MFGWNFKRKLTSRGANFLAATLLQPGVSFRLRFNKPLRAGCAQVCINRGSPYNIYKYVCKLGRQCRTALAQTLVLAVLLDSSGIRSNRRFQDVPQELLAGPHVALQI